MSVCTWTENHLLVSRNAVSAPASLPFPGKARVGHSNLKAITNRNVVTLHIPEPTARKRYTYLFPNNAYRWQCKQTHSLKFSSTLDDRPIPRNAQLERTKNHRGHEIQSQWFTNKTLQPEKKWSNLQWAPDYFICNQNHRQPPPAGSKWQFYLPREQEVTNLAGTHMLQNQGRDWKLHNPLSQFQAVLNMRSAEMRTSLEECLEQ